MDKRELDTFLFQYTDSEKRHMLTDRQVLSKRYDSIPKIQFQDREVYLFTFSKLFEGNYVCVNKESRFTYIPEHIHTVIEFVYVYSGNCTQVINGKRVTITQGDICMLDTSVPHSVEYLDKDDIIISIEMQKEYLTRGFLLRLGDDGIINRFLANTLSMNTAHDQYLLFKKQKENQIHSILQNILCEYYDPQFCSDKVIDAYMILLFCEILRQYRHQQISSTQRGSQNIIEILNYIENNYATTSLKDTAAHFGFHPNYLSSYIKRNTGHSFKELVIMQKMFQASFYLINTDLPVYEIASRVGYDNLGHFYRKFEALYKMKPQTYRKLKSNVLN